LVSPEKPVLGSDGFGRCSTISDTLESELLLVGVSRFSSGGS
jgi:hypothetical protein